MASTSESQFPEENLLATADQDAGFLLTRRLGWGRFSSIFLVEDLQWETLSRYEDKYLAAKILSAAATHAVGNGVSHELEALKASSIWSKGKELPPFSLSKLHDHFTQEGPHGVHYCFLTEPLTWNVQAFRASTPTGRLAVHMAKTIVYYVTEAVKDLNARGFIHADIRTDNILFSGTVTSVIEENIAVEPPVIDDKIKFKGVEYPILRSQPLPLNPRITWDITPFNTELIGIRLCDLGSALRMDRPKPLGDIGEFALRAPENIVRAECGEKIDIWAIGCLAYEFLTGQVLFRPQPIPDLTPDQSLLLLQYALTGEALSKEVVEQSCVKDQYFDQDGALSNNSYPNMSPS